MLQYLSRSFFRYRSPLRSSPIRSIYRYFLLLIFIFTFSSLAIPLIFSVLIFRTDSSASNSSDTIISLTTVPARFHVELPLTIHSLLSQTQLPKEIRIYLSPRSVITEQGNLTLFCLKKSLKQLDNSERLLILFDKLVEIRLEDQDYGPATKFLPIIREFQSKSQAIMICDDDQYYHPYTLATLNAYADQYPDSIIGFRGWRVRQDLIWGVRSVYEMAYHVVESQYIAEVYRVGVITANYGYLIRPSFFDSHIYLDFNRAPNDVRRVDDIWMNGHAARRNIARYVIPSCYSPTSLTQTHALETYLRDHQMDRFTANKHALEWFADDWEIHLWYRFSGVNAPIYSSWPTWIYREWIGMILRLKLFIYLF